MDTGVLIEKAIKMIADVYDLEAADVKKAISGSEYPLDLPTMVDEGIYCFRGPDDEVRYENASLCLSNKILANPGVAKALLPVICSRVMQWDREDVNELLLLIRQAVSIMELNPDCYKGSCFIDINGLPSEDIPEDLGSKCRIWAMDKRGMCLVGIDADQVMHVDDMRKS
ncbi:MAG: hypothetical protein Q8J68_11805 [Methanolobus sp.]|uniref:hypothetical protein n=1 Tax=Methanolobus sp. TaxID=1874737 RepID=UPI00272FE98F|nr:hypothetical protein [Methanolobus sp.]MDP2217957.1 hypothetical protein [Methanolobus sp.]